MQPRPPDRDRAGLIEALSVFLLILLYIWRVRLFHPGRWLVIAGILAVSHAARGEGAQALGLRWPAFRRAFRALAPWVLGLAGALLAAGFLLDTVNPVVLGRTPGSLSLYLVWGVLQQWLLNGYLLRRLLGAGANPRQAAPAAALLFSAAHLPNPFLIGVTLGGGYLAARLFLRYESLWVLGLAHGLIGFLLNLVAPDWISGRFLVGPRYILHQFGTYPEALL